MSIELKIGNRLYTDKPTMTYKLSVVVYSYFEFIGSKDNELRTHDYLFSLSDKSELYDILELLIALINFKNNYSESEPDYNNDIQWNFIENFKSHFNESDFSNYLNMISKYPLEYNILESFKITYFDDKGDEYLVDIKTNNI